MSIYEWYKLYNDESKKNCDIKREYLNCLFGTFKLSFYFGIFADIFLGISILMTPLFNFLFLDEIKININIEYMFIGIPLMFLLVFSVMIILYFCFKSKILYCIENEVFIENNFFAIFLAGLNGWFQTCLYIGVNKKEKNKFG